MSRQVLANFTIGRLTASSGESVYSRGGVRMGSRKAAANLKRHRVSFHEAAAALEDPLSITSPDEAYALGGRAALPDDRRVHTRAYLGRGAHGAKRYRPYHPRQTSNEARATIL